MDMIQEMYDNKYKKEENNRAKFNRARSELRDNMNRSMIGHITNNHHIRKNIKNE